jgi:cell division transport system permease protein
MSQQKRQSDAKKAKTLGAAKVSGKNNSFQSYINNHLKVSKLSLKEQTDRPFSSLLTCSVIGIALVLPTLLLILLSNINAANIDWEGSAKITLFLHQNTTALEAGTLSQSIAAHKDVADTLFIDKDQALEEFRAQFELGDVVEFLDNNPLPHAIIVTPADSLEEVVQIERLMQELEALKPVESGLLDALWVQRLQSITSFLEKAVLLIALMLAVAVLLILGNTIRLAIENRKEEIAVLKLVGGTTPFVCRPFLYMGVLYGLGGSIIAVILTAVIIAILNTPIEELARSYQSTFELSGLDFESTLLLILFGTSLGWLGAWLAVRRHLDEIEPT